MQTQHKVNGKIVLIILLALAAAGIIVQIVSSLIEAKAPWNRIEKTIFPVNGPHFSRSITSMNRDYIAVLRIEGVIEKLNKTYDQGWLLDTISALKNDKKNRGIMIDINSPGGGVFEADEVYLALLDYKTSGKPVWAYLEQMAASGGYYIACAADSIYANRNTLTGSIGVIFGPAVDLTALMDKYGIKMTTFTAGKNKNMLNINSSLTPEQIAIMQSIVDEAYDQFTGIVAQGRNMPLETVKTLADGRIYTALQAEKNKLIDGVCSYEEALQNMIDTCFAEEREPLVEYLEPKYRQSLYDYFTEIKTILRGGAVERLPLEMLEKVQQQPMRPSYLFNWGN